MALAGLKRNVRTGSGAIIPAAEIEVRFRENDGTAGALATIYSNNEGTTAITQPGFVTDADGAFEFFAASGQYLLVVGSGASQESVPIDIVNANQVLHFDGRAALEAWVAAGYIAPDGTVISDGTVQYVATTGATAISDMSGWLPFGEMTSKHVGGVTQAQIDAMYDYQGYVVIKGAETAAATVQVLDRIIFEDGAYVSVNSGITFEIQGGIESGKQHIFRGDGSISLTNDNTGDRSGEESRMLHASWFGVFPSGDKTRDEGPAIEKASSSFGNGREGVIEFDIGNYQVNSQVDLSRGTLILGVDGSGDRRTVFKTNTDGFPLFNTLNDACAWKGIQFEKHSTLADRTSPWVQINDDGCVVDRVNMGETSAGVLVADGAFGTRIAKINATYGTARGAGSYLVKAAEGTTTVEDIFLPSSNVGPEAIVVITSADGTVSDFSVENVRWQSPAIGVLIDASGGNVAGVNITDLRNRQFTGTACPAGVKVQTSGAHSASNIIVDGVNATSLVDYALDIDQSSTGEVEDVVITNVTMQGAGYVVNASQSAGAVNNLVIGQIASASREIIQNSGVAQAQIRIASESAGLAAGRYVSVEGSPSGDAGVQLVTDTFEARMFVDESSSDLVFQFGPVGSPVDVFKYEGGADPGFTIVGDTDYLNGIPRRWVEMTVANDTVWNIVPPRNGMDVRVMANADTTTPQLQFGGIVRVDVGATSPLIETVHAGVNFSTTGATLTGTTGTAGKVTVGPNGPSNEFQLENRSGLNMKFTVFFE